MSGLTTLSVTLWEQVVSHLEGKHLGSVRCVCQTARQAVENYVQKVIITESSIDAAPDLSRWSNLQTIIITDDMKAPYPELMSLGTRGKPFIVLCGKSSWWKTDWLREWVAKEQHTRDATLGMLLCIVGLEDEEGDISAEIEEVMKDDGKLPVTYLGLWSHLEQGVPLERLVWKKIVPDLSRLEGLYLEFIEVDQEVLQCMTKLAKLRILFEEACTTVIDAVQHMPQLKTLHLEPIAEDSLCPEALFTLGKNIQELCILGSVSMLSLMDHHSWLAYVLDLFANLPHLNNFFCIVRTDELFSGHMEKSAWVSVDHLKVIAMGNIFIAYDKDSDRISGAFRTYKDAQGADPKLAHQLRYPRLN